MRYNADADGTIQYIGRKDTQVKLRGQRNEIDEVEYHLRACLPTGTEATVMIITLADLSTFVLAASLFILLMDQTINPGERTCTVLYAVIERHLRSISTFVYDSGSICAIAKNAINNQW